MADIRYFKLHNRGAFVARIMVCWAGTDNDGKRISGRFEQKSTISAGKSCELDLSGTNIRDGCTVQLEAFVVWGKDNKAKQTHTYRSSSNKVATYVITGTTLDNRLGEESVADKN